MPQKLKLDTSWEEVKEKLKEINVSLSDEDLQYQPGEDEELYERLSKKLSMNPEEVRKWIESVSANKGKAS